MANIFLETHNNNIIPKRLNIFAVVHTMFTNTYDTLYYEAKKDKNINFTFITIPFCHEEVSNSIDEINLMMKNKGYEYIQGYDKENNSYLDLKKLNPDAVFLQTPYDGQRISKLFSSKYLSNFTKVYHISYGSTIINYDFPPYDNIFYEHTHFTKIFSESTLAKYLNKYCDNKFIPIGYMKCDKFLNYKNNKDFKFKQKNTLYNKVIAWKPRWFGTLGESNFLRYIDYFKNFAINNKDILILFIKHPLIKDELVKRKIYTKKEADILFNEIKKIKNIQIVEDDNFLEDIFNADIFIGDYCSTIIEFMLTKKPIIYTPCEVTLSEYGKNILEGMYIVNNIKEMDIKINTLLKDNDKLKEIRKKKIPLITDIHSDKTIAQYLLDLLKNENDNFKNQTTKIKTQKSNLSFKNKIRYKIWKHFDKILRKKGIIK